MKITDLRKKTGSLEIDIPELHITGGRIHGLVGPNGCGKTTLLKMIAGIIEPDEGTIDAEGLRPSDITMTSQRPYMMHTSVYENVIYPLKIRKAAINEAEIDDLLDRVGLLGQKKQYAGSLSSGERQKLSLLRVLVFRPSLVMVDETLSNLDSDSEQLFREMILERQREDKSTWLIVSHQWDRMNSLFDEVHFMEKGRIVK